MKIQSDFEIRPARVEDVPVILELIRDLATYERAPDRGHRDGRTTCRRFIRRTTVRGSSSRV